MKNIKRNKIFESLLTEGSLSMLYDMLKIYKDNYKQLDMVDKINDAIDKENENIQNTEYNNLFAELGDITFSKTIRRGNGFVLADVIFKVVKHIPTKTFLLLQFTKDALKAVKISSYTDSSTIIGSIKELHTNSSLKNDNYIRMIKDDLFDTYGKNVNTGDNKTSMMNDIQYESRDEENNPSTSNAERAKLFRDKIKEFTGIKVDWREFMQTRNAKAQRKDNTGNYLYVGGFNLGDDITVRVCRYLGANPPGYNLYHVYVRYCEYAFILKIEYWLKTIIVRGGTSSGTAYQMLKAKKYLSVNDVRPDTTTSDIKNIYNVLKTLNGPDYTFYINDEEISTANILLKKITDIIRIKEMMDRGINSRAGSNSETITFEKHITKAYAEKLQDIKNSQKTTTKETKAKEDELL